METIREQAVLTVGSPSFINGGDIPVEFTCQGEGINPELTVKGIPKTTRTLALVLEDPDAPGGIFDHWVVFNIPPLEKIDEDSSPGSIGRNSKGNNNYHPPCPPTGSHHYIFKIFALDSLVYLDENAGKEAMLAAMESHVLAYGELTGLYSKS